MASACVIGDFFKDPLPEADLYILARVLHDWTDVRCSHLLARIHRACKPGGSWVCVSTRACEYVQGGIGLDSSFGG